MSRWAASAAPISITSGTAASARFGCSSRWCLSRGGRHGRGSRAGRDVGEGRRSRRGQSEPAVRRAAICLEGLPNQCLDMRFYGSAMRMPHVQGAFRNALVCDAVQCVKVADHVPLSFAALAEPFAVGLHAVSRAEAADRQARAGVGLRADRRAGGGGGARARRGGDRRDRRRRGAAGRGERARRRPHDQCSGRCRLGRALRRRQGHVRRDDRVFGQCARAA